MEAAYQDPSLVQKKIDRPDNCYLFRKDEIEIPFRLLTVAEYNSYRSALDNNLIDEHQFSMGIWSRCILDQYRIDVVDDLPAGIIDTITKLIWDMSAPRDVDEFLGLLDTFRERAQQTDEMMKFIIMSIFPAYTLDVLDSITFDTVLRLFAGAEAVIIQRGGTLFDLKKQQRNQRGTITKEDIKAHNVRTS